MSYKFLAKYGPTLAFALFVVCVVISMIPIIGGVSDFSSVPVEKQSYSEEGGIFLAGIYISVALLIVAIIVAIIFSVFQVISNPKASTKALISFGLVAVAFFLLYSMADAKGTGSLARTIESFNIGEGISKLIGGGIQLSVFMLIGSFVVAIVMEIWNYFKNQ
jgi:hypothetical protein